MSVSNIQTTAFDHIPEEFKIEDLRANGFSEEEIKGLASGDDDDPALIVIADDPEPAQDDDPLANAESVGNPPPEEEPAKPEAKPQQLPQIDIPDTTEAESVIASLDLRMADLQEKYDNGELMKAELVEQTKALILEQARAQSVIDQAAQAINTVKQSAEQIFYAAQDAYYKAGAADLMKPEHIDAWDRHLREVTGNRAFAALGAEQLIELAHKRYADEYLVVHGTPLPVAIPQASTPAKMERRTDPRPEAPQTLANVNGDLSAAMGDSRKAVVDTLASKDPIRAEQELERLAQMSPDEYDNYLRFA